VAEERFERLEQSNKTEHVVTRNKLDANQASLPALIVLLTPQHQGILLPLASLMPVATTLTAPIDPVLVELPPLPPLVGGLQESIGKIMPATAPTIVLPQVGGLLFSNIAALRNENLRESESLYHTQLAKEVKDCYDRDQNL
jgi:hypothetical protein